jgi:hypothetical protein
MLNYSEDVFKGVSKLSLKHLGYDQLHELSELIGITIDKINYSRSYADKLKELSGQSDWEYIRLSTKGSDLVLLNEDQD